MQMVRSVLLEAMQLKPDSIRQVSEWIVPAPGRSGYSWYEGSPARFRTKSGDMTVDMGCWIVRFGTNFIAFSQAEFENLFDPAAD